ncbi:MAG: hypothetical protein PHU27_11950 [Salinivirgaceae bacterium]|nr:hypothetical protein [Salinivirgaceae bacterium]MDD4746987.1 hypothetical protein [Salinivirgaceae bacterium]
MKYSIHIDHNFKIIRYTHSGIINAEDIGEAWNKLLVMKEFTELKYNLLSDYTGGEFQMSLDFLPKLMEFMRAIKSIVRGKKQALIVDEPYSVAGSLLFENEVNKEIGFLNKVFATETKALEWLL